MDFLWKLIQHLSHSLPPAVWMETSYAPLCDANLKRSLAYTRNTFWNISSNCIFPSTLGDTPKWSITKNNSYKNMGTSPPSHFRAVLLLFVIGDCEQLRYIFSRHGVFVWVELKWKKKRNNGTSGARRIRRGCWLIHVSIEKKGAILFVHFLFSNMSYTFKCFTFVMHFLKLTEQ